MPEHKSGAPGTGCRLFYNGIYADAAKILCYIRGQPAMMLSDNSSQLVSAERELLEMIKWSDVKQLKELSAEKGMKWQFSTPAAPVYWKKHYQLYNYEYSSVVDRLSSPAKQ